MTYDDDERHGHAILAPLSDLGEPPPPAYNISAAVGTGRRRRIAAVAGIAAVTALAVAAAPTALATFRDGKQENVAASPSATPSVPALPSSCELNLLPEPAGMYSTIVGAMDPTGRFIAGYGESRVNGNMVSTPVLWQDGRPQLVGRRGLNIEVTDVNSRGVAVATTVPGEPAAWIYRDGELSRLSARSLEARAINERGDIVGATGDTNRPFVLCNGGGKVVELPLPPGTTRGVATDIDEDAPSSAGCLRRTPATRTSGFLTEREQGHPWPAQASPRKSATVGGRQSRQQGVPVERPYWRGPDLSATLPALRRDQPARLDRGSQPGRRRGPDLRHRRVGVAGPGEERPAGTGRRGRGDRRRPYRCRSCNGQ